MSLKNSVERWGHVSQLLHWLIVVLIVVMAYLGLTMTDLANSPHKIRVYDLHKSIGLSILVLVSLRLLWRAYAGAPRTLPGVPTWQARVAAFTHGALYALLFAVPISGWVLNSAAGFPLRWFNLVNLPSIAAKGEALQTLAKDWHEFLFWALIVLSLAHAAAAVYHHLFQHDATLARMLPQRRARITESPDVL
ncbi:MAG TPA: cytochrome b [Luteimonas sp.]|nr:cytochrome b [Luteimonas sp.]